jgi:hypothetical protein
MTQLGDHGRPPWFGAATLRFARRIALFWRGFIAVLLSFFNLTINASSTESMRNMALGFVARCKVLHENFRWTCKVQTLPTINQQGPDVKPATVSQEYGG